MTSNLSRREREIMEIVYAKGGATAADIHENLADPPGRGAVRKLVQILEAKGHLKHIKQGREHVYQPVRAKQSAAKKALQSLLDTFFGGNLSDAVAIPSDRPGRTFLRRGTHQDRRDHPHGPQPEKGLRFMNASFLSLLTDTALRGAAWLAIAWIAFFTLRALRASAATRHLLCAATFAALALLPLVIVALPAWRLLPAPAPKLTATVTVGISAVGDSASLRSAASVRTQDGSLQFSF